MRTFLLASALLAPLAAEAAPMRYVADLIDLQNLGVSGRAMVSYDSAANTLSVGIKASGLTPDMPHAQHIHGPSMDLAGGGRMAVDARTPTIADDADGDGFIELLEGVPSYGPVLFSLTDAMGDFPTAPDGTIDFFQSYDLSTSGNFGGGFGASDLLPLYFREIVIHGAFLMDGQGDTNASSLILTTPNGPFGNEADGTAGYKGLLPVLAGELQPAPVPLPAAAWMLIAGLGALGAVRFRR